MWIAKDGTINISLLADAEPQRDHEVEGKEIVL